VPTHIRSDNGPEFVALALRERLHQTLKITPAMAAGVTAKLWEMSDMVKVLEDWEAAQA